MAVTEVTRTLTTDRIGHLYFGDTGFDSICLMCFSTIVSNIQNEKDLQQYELQHVCPRPTLCQLHRHYLHTL